MCPCQRSSRKGATLSPRWSRDDIRAPGPSRRGRRTARAVHGGVLGEARDAGTHIVDGADGLRAALKRTHDAVILDLMLPTMDGLAVCRQLRAHSDVPVIMVTARIQEVDRVSGLELGADDYVSKPFSPRELLARLRATVRRARGMLARESVLRVGSLELSTSSMTATLRGRVLDLTSYEFAILRVMAERCGHPLTREQILDTAKGSAEDAFDRSIDVRISRLRQKLGDDPRRPTLLRTVRGVGYVLAWDDDR